MGNELGFVNKSLQQQGFCSYSPKQLTQLQWGLRFTPAICMLLALLGLFLQMPAIHFTLAVLGILPMILPAHHPFDLFYNHALRPLWNGVRLPANPLPRRIACFAGGTMNLGVGLAFSAGQPMLAYLLGGVLVFLQLIVITTHFCVASWLYEGLLRLIGKWEPPVKGISITRLCQEGALIVDVREPHEFDKGHLQGAINLPLSRLPQCLDQVEGKQLLVYCQSGMRSQKATQILKGKGHASCHNLGSYSQAERLLKERKPTS